MRRLIFFLAVLVLALLLPYSLKAQESSPAGASSSRQMSGTNAWR